MQPHTVSHLLGATVLSAVAPHLPSGEGLVAALAASGLFLSGLSQLVKQVLELWRSYPPTTPPSAPK